MDKGLNLMDKNQMVRGGPAPQKSLNRLPAATRLYCHRRVSGWYSSPGTRHPTVARWRRLRVTGQVARRAHLVVVLARSYKAGRPVGTPTTRLLVTLVLAWIYIAGSRGQQYNPMCQGWLLDTSSIVWFLWLGQSRSD